MNNNLNHNLVENTMNKQHLLSPPSSKFAKKASGSGSDKLYEDNFNFKSPLSYGSSRNRNNNGNYGGTTTTFGNNNNEFNDFRFDTQLSQTKKREENYKDDVKAFKHKYNKIIDDFFDVAPYSIKSSISSKSFSKREDKEDPKVRKETIGSLNGVIEKKKKFFMNFPNQYDYFDDKKKGK